MRLHDVATSIRHEVGFRMMSASDEATFQRLLTAVYGNTYAYQDFYARGGYGRLVHSGKALLAGEFDDAGELVGHVAFLRKDPSCDYVEQGIAFRHPTRRSSATRAMNKPLPINV